MTNIPKKLDGEVWKPVIGYENQYLVSSMGRVWSFNYRRTRCGSILKNDDKNKYHSILLSKKGKHSRKYIHRLVAETFIPNPHNLPQINHKDGNKYNNCVENLEWCTQSENSKHAFMMGLEKQKLSKEDVVNIRNKGIAGRDEIMKHYGISISAFYRIIKRETWTNV